jgi:hypothetical protein
MDRLTELVEFGLRAWLFKLAEHDSKSAKTCPTDKLKKAKMAIVE